VDNRYPRQKITGIYDDTSLQRTAGGISFDIIKDNKKKWDVYGVRRKKWDRLNEKGDCPGDRSLNPSPRKLR